MKKIFFSLVILISIGFLWFRVHELSRQKAELRNNVQNTVAKGEILRFALVADSENDNEHLETALAQAKSAGAGFVIMLGDLTQLGVESDLVKVKQIFDKSGLPYYMTPGDHDLWDSRNQGNEALANFRQVFGKPTQAFSKNGIEFIIVDNSDIYMGISNSDWGFLESNLNQNANLKFVFSHMTPYHPQSAHIMGSEKQEVASQAKEYMKLLEDKKVDGLFTGDLHFFAQFKSPANVVRISTIGAVDEERNFQGPRFAIVRVYSDYTWEVEDLEIR